MFLQYALLIILIIDGIALTGIILLQKSEGGGLVSGGGGGQFMTARGTANLLTRTTEILTAVFFVTSLLITILIGRSSTSANSVVDKVHVQGLSAATLAAQQKAAAAQAAAEEKAAQQQQSGAPAPSLPSAPPPSFGAPRPPSITANPFGPPPSR